MRVLVVDDNATSRRILRDMLESLDFNVSLAGSGPEATAEVEAAVGQERPYDLILMDWKMPGMNGIEASRAIKDIPALRSKPRIVMVTAYGREEVMHRAKAAELDGFLIKPVSASINPPTKAASSSSLPPTLMTRVIYLPALVFLSDRTSG